MRTYLTCACLSCLVTSAGAEDLLHRPESCVRTATAQYSTCEVYNHFTCPGTLPVLYRVESTDGDGILTVETYDQNWGAVGMVDSSGDISATFTAQTQHPRVALETGLRTEDLDGSIGVLGARLTITGSLRYRFSGETITTAGATFHSLPFEGSVTTEGTVFGTDMAFTLQVQGTMLFNDDLDLWLEDHSRTKIDGEPDEISHLARLSLPGQEGFGVGTPIFGCGGLSLLPLSSKRVPA